MKKLLFALLFCSFSICARAQTIYWAGGEDVDFPNGSAVSATNSTVRSGYARAAVAVPSSGNYALSVPFSAGTQTSAWLHFQETGCGLFVGFATSGTAYSVLAGASNNDGNLYLVKWDGSTLTALAHTTSAPINCANVPVQLDLQVQNYGASCVLNLYEGASGSAAVSYSGSCAVDSNTNFNSVIISQFSTYGASDYYWGASEIIAASSDTRAMSLVTLAPNANGTTQSWTNPAYTNINPITINDANFTYDTNSGDVSQYKANCLPSGTSSILAIKTIARAATASGALQHLQVGLFNGSTDSLGSSTAIGTSFFPIEKYFATNPFTSAAWQRTDIGCSSSSTVLQTEIKSGT